MLSEMSLSFGGLNFYQLHVLLGVFFVNADDGGSVFCNICALK